MRTSEYYTFLHHISFLSVYNILESDSSSPQPSCLWKILCQTTAKAIEGLSQRNDDKGWLESQGRWTEEKYFPSHALDFRPGSE